MKLINILGVDNINILTEFLNYKKLLEEDLNREKEMSYEEFIGYLKLEKHVFIYKQNSSITFSKIKIKDEDVIFYTLDKDMPKEGEELFYKLINEFDEKNLKKQNIFSEDSDILEREYYYIINNDFYY